MFPCDYIGIGGYTLHEYDFDEVCFSILKYDTNSNLNNIGGCLFFIRNMTILCAIFDIVDRMISCYFSETAILTNTDGSSFITKEMINLFVTFNLICHVADIAMKYFSKYV